MKAVPTNGRAARSPRPHEVLRSRPVRQDQAVRIGTAGWSIARDAAESFPGLGSHLERYGRVLTCAEINSTFYRPPRASTWVRWAESVPKEFRFAVKAPKTITHEAGLARSESEKPLVEFLEAASSLGEKLGPLLFQLPPKLTFDGSVARAFFELLRQAYGGAVVVEPRHASWFADEAEAMLRDFRIGRAAADPARIPEAGTTGGWNGLAYYRLHGSPRTYYSRYDGEFLRRLGAEIDERVGGGEVWVIFDNTASGAAIHNALELSELSGQAGERR